MVTTKVTSALLVAPLILVTITRYLPESVICRLVSTRVLVLFCTKTLVALKNQVNTGLWQLDAMLTESVKFEPIPVVFVPGIKSITNAGCLLSVTATYTGALMATP